MACICFGRRLWISIHLGLNFPPFVTFPQAFNNTFSSSDVHFIRFKWPWASRSRTISRLRILFLTAFSFNSFLRVIIRPVSDVGPLSLNIRFLMAGAIHLRNKASRRVSSFHYVNKKKMPKRKERRKEGGGGKGDRRVPSTIFEIMKIRMHWRLAFSIVVSSRFDTILDSL